MSIDILFASHNGARTLPRMIAALEKLNAPKGEWRVIAVDNASTDDTHHLLRDAAKRLPLIPLSCPTPGKMPAQKLGLQQVKADLVIFTDDDVEPAQDWLVAYEGAAEAHKDCGLFGGPIIPTPMEEVSPWYAASRTHHAELFARSDEPDGPVDAAAHIYGPNFMLRREHVGVLDDIAPGLGPTFAQKSANKFPMGEDTMIMELLTRRGVKSRYVRQASVAHLVRGFQTELDFMLARAERHGRGGAIRYVEQANRSPARRARMIVENWSAHALAKKPNGVEPSSEAFDALWNARWALGAAKGAAFGPWTA